MATLPTTTNPMPTMHHGPRQPARQDAQRQLVALLRRADLDREAKVRLLVDHLELHHGLPPNCDYLWKEKLADGRVKDDPPLLAQVLPCLTNEGIVGWFRHTDAQHVDKFLLYLVVACQGNSQQIDALSDVVRQLAESQLCGVLRNPAFGRNYPHSEGELPRRLQAILDDLPHDPVRFVERWTAVRTNAPLLHGDPVHARIRGWRQLHDILVEWTRGPSAAGRTMLAARGGGRAGDETILADRLAEALLLAMPADMYSDDATGSFKQNCLLALQQQLGGPELPAAVLSRMRAAWSEHNARKWAPDPVRLDQQVEELRLSIARHARLPADADPIWREALESATPSRLALALQRTDPLSIAKLQRGLSADQRLAFFVALLDAAGTHPQKRHLLNGMFADLVQHDLQSLLPLLKPRIGKLGGKNQSLVAQRLLTMLQTMHLQPDQIPERLGILQKAGLLLHGSDQDLKSWRELQAFTAGLRQPSFNGTANNLRSRITTRQAYEREDCVRTMGDLVRSATSNSRPRANVADQVRCVVALFESESIARESLPKRLESKLVHYLEYGEWYDPKLGRFPRARRGRKVSANRSAASARNQSVPATTADAQTQQVEARRREDDRKMLQRTGAVVAIILCFLLVLLVGVPFYNTYLKDSTPDDLVVRQDDSGPKQRPPLDQEPRETSSNPAPLNFPRIAPPPVTPQVTPPMNLPTRPPTTPSVTPPITPPAIPAPLNPAPGDAGAMNRPGPASADLLPVPAVVAGEPRESFVVRDDFEILVAPGGFGDRTVHIHGLEVFSFTVERELLSGGGRPVEFSAIETPPRSSGATGAAVTLKIKGGKQEKIGEFLISDGGTILRFKDPLDKVNDATNEFKSRQGLLRYCVIELRSKSAAPSVFVALDKPVVAQLNIESGEAVLQSDNPDDGAPLPLLPASASSQLYMGVGGLDTPNHPQMPIYIFGVHVGDRNSLKVRGQQNWPVPDLVKEVSLIDAAEIRLVDGGRGLRLITTPDLPGVRLAIESALQSSGKTREEQIESIDAEIESIIDARRVMADPKADPRKRLDRLNDLVAVLKIPDASVPSVPTPPKKPDEKNDAKALADFQSAQNRFRGEVVKFNKWVEDNVFKRADERIAQLNAEKQNINKDVGQDNKQVLEDRKKLPKSVRVQLYRIVKAGDREVRVLVTDVN